MEQAMAYVCCPAEESRVRVPNTISAVTPTSGRTNGSQITLPVSEK